MSQPKKVNSHLKKLAEFRARATATIERLNSSLVELQPSIEEARAALLHLEELKFNIEHRLNHYHNEIRAADKIIQEKFPGVEPTEILSTYGFRSEYGGRGALQKVIRDVIFEADHEGIELKNLSLKVSERLSLVHFTQADFKKWVQNSLKPAIYSLKFEKKLITNRVVPGKRSRWTLVNKQSFWDDLVQLDHEVGE